MSQTMKRSGPDIEALFARARDGDQAAWQQLFETCQEKLLRSIRRKLRSPRSDRSPLRKLYDSTDFASDVWKSLAANCHRFTFDSFEALVAFLAQAAEKKVDSAYRAQLSQKRDMTKNRPIIVNADDIEALLPSSDPSPSQVVMAQDFWEHILARISDEDKREALRLKEQGYTTDEIAGLMGWTRRKVQRGIEHAGQLVANSRGA